MYIEHMGFNVPDASAQVQWYVQHLGIKIVRQLNDANQTHFVVDAGERIVLEFYTNPLAPIPDYAAIHALAQHLALAVDDITAERERLIAVGATPDGEIYQTSAGDQLAFLRDPWGLCIQLAQRQQPLLRL